MLNHQLRPDDSERDDVAAIDKTEVSIKEAVRQYKPHEKDCVYAVNRSSEFGGNTIMKKNGRSARHEVKHSGK